MKRVHGFVKGRVQGVSFRYFARNKASSLNLVGWIKNLEDGRVEFVAEGKENDVENFIAYCKKGSFFSKVDEVELREEKSVEKFKIFEIRY